MNATAPKARAGARRGWEARANAWTHLPEAPMDRSYGRCRPAPLRDRPRAAQGPNRSCHASGAEARDVALEPRNFGCARVGITAVAQVGVATEQGAGHARQVGPVSGD